MNDPEIEAKLGGAVLGVHWSAKDDLMAVRFRVNIGPTRKQACLEPDLNEETVDNVLATQKLTKRLCLRLTMMQYDALGIATPVILWLKALMQ